MKARSTKDGNDGGEHGSPETLETPDGGAWAEEALLHEALVEPRRAFIPAADTEVIERPGWQQLITPSLRTGGLNEVTFCAADEGEIDELIDAAMARYAAHRIHFRWSVPPGSRPADLVDRLLRRGFTASTVHAMVGTTAGASARAERVPIEAVTSATADEFTHTLAKGWGLEPEGLADYTHRTLSAPEQACRLFLARPNPGKPAAGCAGMFLFERSVYLLGAVVLPEHRGQGIYRALVTERQRVAASLGVELATSHARESTSAPILARLGFRTLCRFPMMSWSPDGEGAP